jgi:hypothetical protein
MSEIQSLYDGISTVHSLFYEVIVRRRSLDWCCVYGYAREHRRLRSTFRVRWQDSCSFSRQRGGGLRHLRRSVAFAVRQHRAQPSQRLIPAHRSSSGAGTVRPHTPAYHNVDMSTGRMESEGERARRPSTSPLLACGTLGRHVRFRHTSTLSETICVVSTDWVASGFGSREQTLCTASAKRDYVSVSPRHGPPVGSIGLSSTLCWMCMENWA